MRRRGESEQGVARIGPRQYLRYLDQGGRERVVVASQAAEVAFEDARPVRVIPHYRGSAHTPGEYWSVTMDRLVAYESFLECRWMMLLDFDGDVAAFCGQPFEVGGVDATGVWRHVPDLFVRNRDGGGLVLDVKHPRHLNRRDVLEQAERTRRFCEAAGWRYRLVGQPDHQVMTNIAWLHGYRRPLHAGAELVAELLVLGRPPQRIDELLNLVANPMLARPVLFHLLWHGQMACDLAEPLRESTLVWAKGSGDGR